MSDLDPTDLAILRILASDATTSAARIGRAVGIGQPAAWRRIRKLTDQGILAGRRVVVDNTALGFGVTVFLGVRLATKGRTSLEDFERAVTAIPEVQIVQHVLGQFDYRLRVTAREGAADGLQAEYGGRRFNGCRLDIDCTADAKLGLVARLGAEAGRVTDLQMSPPTLGDVYLHFSNLDAEALQ